MRRRGISLFLLFVVVLGVAPAVRAGSTDDDLVVGAVSASTTADTVVVENGLARRVYTLAPFATSEVTDLRTGQTWAGDGEDFSLNVGGVAVPGSAFTAKVAALEALERGVRVRFELTPGAAAPVSNIRIERVVEVYEGVAGFRTSMVVHAPAGAVPLRGGVIDSVAVGSEVSATTHAFRAGADWREPGWQGPALAVGDPRSGTWRETKTGTAGEAIGGAGQWVSASTPADLRLFAVLERNDQPSSLVSYDGSRVAAEVDYSRDVVVLGPFEEQIHAENPAPGTTARQRIATPLKPVQFEAVFVGLATSGADEAWQFHKYLTKYRLTPYPKQFVFNSNGTDSGVISTGAKDDVDIAVVREIAPKLRSLGIDTFVLDDGWQAISGDWEPDSPGYPDPRGLYPPRFPDATFAAVREAIAPMKLGLWMSPMHFRPDSQTYRNNPTWACAPAGHGLALYNTADMNSSSNEAGIGQWGPAAIPWVESRIERAITEWDVSYFKFDFLAWLDCAEQGDLYDYREAFIAMLDRLQAAYPGVTFQIDETNDYRLFPFESVTRGPSWFQNGTPTPDRLLHNLWNLSPYVPAFSLGQQVLGGRQWRTYPVETLMAVGLLSHMTVFSDVRGDAMPQDVVDRAAPWAAFHRRNADLLDGVVYPLLEDPLAKRWTAMQSWDADAGRGALLAFRQDDPRGTVTVALENVPDGVYEVRSAPDGALVGEVDASALRSGLDVSSQVNGAVVLTIERIRG